MQYAVNQVLIMNRYIDILILHNFHIRGFNLEQQTNAPVSSAVFTYQTGAIKHEKVSGQLFEDALMMTAGFSRTLALNSISAVRMENYRIHISALGGDIVLSMLGHVYEDFGRSLIRAFNEVILNESLMKEQTHFETDGSYISPDGKICHAYFRICETALVIIPDSHELVRIPFCMIENVRLMPYRFELIDRFKRVYVIQKLGYNTDAFLRAYDTRFKALLKQTRERLNLIAPADDKLCSLLMEGMVASLEAIKAASPEFASALKAKLEASELSAEFAYLSSLSEHAAIGVKRGLMGELTGESIMMLIPVFEKNIMILETLGDTAAATYVFRISSDGAADASGRHDVLLAFNYAMLSVNFRREPIYLSDEALKEKKHEAYSGALRRVPELSKLRSLFLGRVVHSGFDTWKKTIDSYIK